MTEIALIALILLTGSILQGCAVTAETEYPGIEPAPVYDKLYPYYVEACAVSQIKATFAKPGGTPGHATMYIKGACIDHSESYPRLALCDPQTIDLNDPESGSGISVNKTFKNVNWMAVPGRKLFFEGLLDEGKVNEKAVLDTIEAAYQNGAWKGIDIHEQYHPETDSLEDQIRFLASETLGTDFALRFGRHVYCSRLPMPREQLGRIIDYLNALNDEYASGQADYNWSGYSDNCSHVIHNSLANAGIWKPQKVQVTKFRQLFNLSIPANEVIDLALLTTSFPVDRFDRVYANETMRLSLVQDNWLPTRHGAMVKYLTIHRDNELYDTGETIFILELPGVRAKSSRFSALFDDPHNIQVERNLRHYQSLYERILRDRPVPWVHDAAPGYDYAETRERYYAYIEAQLADVNDKLAVLDSVKEAGQGTANQ